MTRISFDIDTGKVSRWLIFLSLTVIVLGLLREVYVSLFGLDTVLKDLRQIALDTEHCLGSYYSSLLMVIAAALMTVIGQRCRPGKQRYQWYFLAVLFTCMSFDESVSFHEVLIDPLRSALSLTGMLHFAWVIPGALVTVLIVLAYIPFVLALEQGLRIGIVLSGALYVTGALGMEAVGGHFHSIGGFDHPYYIVSFVIEELLEVTGLTLFAVTLLKALPLYFDADSAITGPYRDDHDRPSARPATASAMADPN